MFAPYSGHLILVISLYLIHQTAAGRGQQFNYLWDWKKRASFSEWKVWTCLDSSVLRGLPGSLWLALSEGHSPVSRSQSLQERRLADWTGFPLGSRGSAWSWQLLTGSKSFWDEDSGLMFGMGRAGVEGTLWDNCIFFMCWITEAALKACCWRSTKWAVTTGAACILYRKTSSIAKVSFRELLLELWTYVHNSIISETLLGLYIYRGGTGTQCKFV